MIFQIPYNSTGFFSPIIDDYLKGDSYLHNLVNHFPELENFEKQINEKRKQKVDRELLCNLLSKQNQGINLSKLSNQNILSIKDENTFTVTTGHQLCLITGPLYFFYKIISTINLCEELKNKYPKYKFVPIFWMATEDHDFEEINHINIFKKTFRWMTNQKGAVGRMSLNGIDSVLKDLQGILYKGKHSKSLNEILNNAYLKNNTLSQATRSIVNDLFGKYGLVILDADNKKLKQLFVTQIKKDILENAFCSSIRNSTEFIEKKYSSQAQISKINFFKLGDQVREKIKETVNAEIIEKFPENFSPNVLLRPLYQEKILPNIAYVGGGAEISYWMQLKQMFKQENVPFPILVLRNSALIMQKKHFDDFQSLGFSLKDLFRGSEDLKNDYIKRKLSYKVSLKKEKEELVKIYDNIALKSDHKNFVLNLNIQLKKNINILDQIEKKLIKNHKSQNDVSLRKIQKIKDLYFPNGKLQERHLNFVPFYLDSGDNFIKILKDNLTPLNTNFLLLTV